MYKIAKQLIEKTKELKNKRRYYFNSKRISKRINEKGAARKISTILKRLKEKEIINHDATYNRYYITELNKEKLKRYEKELERTLILCYHQPLNHLEPPINIYQIQDGEKKLIAQAKREGTFKPIYHIKEPEEYTIIFHQYKNTGFKITHKDKDIFKVQRTKITRPLQGTFKDKRITITRTKGRKIELNTTHNKGLAQLKSYAFEKALFTYTEEIKELRIPLSAALFAIKQRDVII